WVLLFRLALLPFLHGPSRFADVVHGIAKFLQYGRINRTRAHVILEPYKFSACFFELKAGAPKSFAGDQKFYRNSQQMTFSAPSRTHNARVRRFMRNQIFQLDLAAGRRIRFQFQKAALSVHFGGATAFTHTCSARLLPRGFHGRDEWKAPAAPAVG